MTNQTQELKDRVEAKAKRVEARILELKADSAEKAREQANHLQKELADIRETVAHGYENLKDQSLDKINNWLSK